MKQEKGEITVEATIVISTIIILIFVFIDFCFAMYNRINVTTVADRIAADVSSVYSNQGAEPFLGYISLDRFSNSKIYRHVSIGTSKMDKKLIETAEWYAKYTIKNGETLGSKSVVGEEDVMIELDHKNELGKLQLKVTVTREYSTLCMSPFKIFGLSGKYKCRSTGYGECYDLIDSINNIKLKDELIKRYIGDTELDKTIGNINSIIKNFKSIFG